MVIKPSGPHFFDGICIFYVLKISDLPEKPLYLQISFQNSACILSEAFVSGGIFYVGNYLYVTFDGSHLFLGACSLAICPTGITLKGIR